LAVAIPRYLEEIQLMPGEKITTAALPELAETSVRLSAALDNLTAKITDIKNMRQKIQQLPEARQSEMLELLQDMERGLNEIQSVL